MNETLFNRHGVQKSLKTTLTIMKYLKLGFLYGKKSDDVFTGASVLVPTHATYAMNLPDSSHL